MRDGDDLFFAPGIRFSSLDLTSKRQLPEQLRARAEGYYLQPAQVLCELGRSQAFAAGLLLICAIDFLGGLHRCASDVEGRSVRNDFVKFANKRLRSFKDRHLADRFFDEFRNGLVHECRIKNAGEFSFEHAGCTSLADVRLSINPRALLQEVRDALEHEVSDLVRYSNERDRLASRISEQFAAELGIVERVRRAG